MQVTRMWCDIFQNSSKRAKYSCQMVFSRLKVVSDGTGQPRAELLTATLKTHTGKLVKSAFQGSYKKLSS